MTECKGIVSSVYNGSAIDGPGLRCVVFMAGCNLRCPFCHNPETFEKKGREYTAEELFKTVMRYKPYIKKGGVTFSGGEPFLQADFCAEVSARLKKEGLNIAVETNGSIVHKGLINSADLFIVDLKNYDGTIKNNAGKFLSSCLELKKPVNITNVIIKGKNDSIKCLKEIKAFVSNYPNVSGVEFLPFKKLCSGKYKELGIPFPYENMEEPDEEDMLQIRKSYGAVQIDKRC